MIGLLARASFSGILLVAMSAASLAEGRALVPRIGETVQEFEARARGGRVSKPSRNVVVAADPSGHFFVDPELDGRSVRMVVDTGASLIALTYEDAERVGARLSPSDFRLRMSTANGVVHAAPLRIGEVRVGDLALRDVEAVVLPRGRLEISLLGMSFLKRLRGFDISQGRLSLRD